MFGVSVFDLSEQVPQDLVLENGNFTREYVVNGVSEVLNTEVFVNETTQNGYRRLRIVNDEIIRYHARALRTELSELIVRQDYDVFFSPQHQRLIAICNKENADQARDIMESHYSLKFKKHVFPMDLIIAASSNVRGARFKKVRIQTVTGSSLGGDNVNNTDLYRLLAANGELAQITCKLDTMGQSVSFAVSADGSLLLYTPLDGIKLLDFIADLFNITEADDAAV